MDAINTGDLDGLITILAEYPPSRDHVRYLQVCSDGASAPIRDFIAGLPDVYGPGSRATDDSLAAIDAGDDGYLAEHVGDFTPAGQMALLSHAVSEGRVSAVRILVNAGAPPGDLNQGPLRIALRKGSAEIFGCLCSAHASLMASIAEAGRAALFEPPVRRTPYTPEPQYIFDYHHIDARADSGCMSGARKSSRF